MMRRARPKPPRHRRSRPMRPRQKPWRTPRPSAPSWWTNWPSSGTPRWRLNRRELMPWTGNARKPGSRLLLQLRSRLPGIRQLPRPAFPPRQRRLLLLLRLFLPRLVPYGPHLHLLLRRPHPHLRFLLRHPHLHVLFLHPRQLRHRHRHRHPLQLQRQLRLRHPHPLQHLRPLQHPPPAAGLMRPQFRRL